MSFSFIVFLMIAAIVMGLVSLSANEDVRKARIDGTHVSKMARAAPDLLLFGALVLAHISGQLL